MAPFSLSGFAGKREDRETFYAFTSFTYPTTIFRYDFETGQSRVDASEWPVVGLGGAGRRGGRGVAERVAKRPQIRADGPPGAARVRHRPRGGRGDRSGTRALRLRDQQPAEQVDDELRPRQGAW